MVPVAPRCGGADRDLRVSASRRPAHPPSGPGSGARVAL